MIDEIIKLEGLKNSGKPNSISITPHVVVVVITADYWLQLVTNVMFC